MAMVIQLTAMAAVLRLVSFPDPQYARKEGLVNIVQNF